MTVEARGYPGWSDEADAARIVALEEAVRNLQREGNWRFDPPEPSVPVVFHWTGRVDRFIGLRAGPNEFGSDGAIGRIRWRWDTPDTGGATVDWYLDGVLAFTSTVSPDNPYIEAPDHPYNQEAIVGIVTAVGSAAEGLTAFMYLD